MLVVGSIIKQSPCLAPYCDSPLRIVQPDPFQSRAPPYRLVSVLFPFGQGVSYVLHVCLTEVSCRPVMDERMEHRYRLSFQDPCADLTCSVAARGGLVHQHHPCQVLDRTLLLLGCQHPTELRHESRLTDQLLRHLFFPLPILLELRLQRRPAVCFPDVDRSPEPAAAVPSRFRWVLRLGVHLTLHFSRK